MWICGSVPQLSKGAVGLERLAERLRTLNADLIALKAVRKGARKAAESSSGVIGLMTAGYEETAAYFRS